MGLFCWLIFALSHNEDTDISALLKERLTQQRLDTIALENEMGIWVSFRVGNRTVEGSSAFGYSSVVPPIPAVVGDVVPAGSIAIRLRRVPTSSLVTFSATARLWKICMAPSGEPDSPHAAFNARRPERLQ
jgi:hypothetical protein